MTKDELKEQDIRLNKLCFEYQEKDKQIADLEQKIGVLLSCKNCPENKGGLLCQKEYEDKCLAQKIEFIKELQEENAELKEQISNVRECFISASSGDDFEMAENAREVMEVLDIPCYRHKDKRKKSKLTKAKEIIKKFSEFVNNGIEYDPEHPQEHTDLWNKLCEEAKQFLKDFEVEK